MANCSYKFTDKVPSHLMPVYSKDKEKPNFQTGTEFQKGLFVHGPQAGLLTEDKLTDPIVEYLLEKTDGEGNPIYAHCFEKKGKKDKD